MWRLLATPMTVTRKNMATRWQRTRRPKPTGNKLLGLKFDEIIVGPKGVSVFLFSRNAGDVMGLIIIKLVTLKRDRRGV